MNRSGSVRKTETVSSMKVENRSAREGAGRLRLERYFGKPEQIQKMKPPLYAALGLLVAVDFFVHREHAALIWESIPGFSALFGLIATVLIIFVSKFLGLGLIKPENYYGGQL